MRVGWECVKAVLEWRGLVRSNEPLGKVTQGPVWPMGGGVQRVKCTESEGLWHRFTQ